VFSGVLLGLVHGIFGKQHNHEGNCVLSIDYQGVCLLLQDPSLAARQSYSLRFILCPSGFVITMTSSSHYSPCVVEECFSPLGGMIVSAVDAELRQFPSNNARHLNAPRRRGSSHKKRKSARMQKNKKISSPGDQEMENGQRNFKLFYLFHRFR
jgi:hypothetical protein